MISPAFDTIKTQPKLLFIENHDSFSFNIIAALRSLGAVVSVCNVDEEINILDNFSHILIGPGPGSPQKLPKLKKIICKAINSGLPMLGICLGHQAIAHYFGAKIYPAPMPMHGKVDRISHTKLGLFANIASPATFTRYHSLVVKQAPQHFMVDAHTSDDCIMAIRYKNIFGIQFHPESYLSLSGYRLLGNFLSLR